MSKHDVLAEIKEAREDGFTMWEINKHQMDSIIALKSELAALEAVAEAAEEYTKVHGHNFGSGCACLLCEVEMALAALHGGE